jgi:para-aminobenzoate synthetase component 1
MRVLIEAVPTQHSPESLAEQVRDLPGLAVLRTGSFTVPHARYSIVAAEPMLVFRSQGSACETHRPGSEPTVQFGNPWQHLASLLARFELMDEVDVPFPLGACLGYWGYDLKQFVEPRVTHRAVNDLLVPDCHLGFYPSLVVFDHAQHETWVVATGLDAEGDRTEERARRQLADWRSRLTQDPAPSFPLSSTESTTEAPPDLVSDLEPPSLDRAGFVAAVKRALAYIRTGDIYQVNLARRLNLPCPADPWIAFQRLLSVSPAPFAAYFDCGDFSVASSSPELFLHLSGRHLTTRPIKGTRPRSADPIRDAQLGWELQRSPKENAELLMITDLLRNDVGRVSEYGSVRVPDLMRLERFAQVQHLVSTVEGTLRPELSHLEALASCFPGGSITGAPKIRAMEIIDELEPVARGPYCGCHGYLGFNQESQLSITIRTAVLREGRAWVHTGAGIVADSIPEEEFAETEAKAAGLLAALNGLKTPTHAAKAHSPHTRA